jgi:hypothetical protein
MDKKRGRPLGSQVRQNIAEILFFAKKAYGYDMYRHYCEIFPKVTLRLIYYHLKKGTAAGEFEIHEVKREEGDYSWGPSAEKTYYSLGKNAKPTADKKVASYFSKVKK